MAHTRRSTWCSLRRLGPVRRCALLLRGSLDGVIRCSWCGVELDQASAQVDHVVPRAAGGLDRNDNLVASCASCNAPCNGKGHYRRRSPVSPELAAVLAAPVDLAAGRELALRWYPWAAERFEDSRRRKREARAARSLARHGVVGGVAFPFGEGAT